MCKENVAQKRERKITKNYYRRSMMKCIKNFVAKCEQSDTKKEDTPQKKKYVDYVPVTYF